MKIRFKKILTVLALLAIGNAGHAATSVFVWTNTAGGDWNNSTNWSPNQVPVSGGNVIITNPGTYTVTNASGVTLGSLTLGGTVGIQTLNAASLTLNNVSMVNSNGVLNWNGGEIDSSLTIATNGTLNITNNASYIFSGVLTNNGTVNWTAGNFYGNANTVIYNAGLWQAQSDNQFIVNSGSGQTFINTGTFQKTGGTGTTTIAWNFNTTGTMDVQSGLVNINNWTGNSVLNGTLTGTASLNSSATLVVANNAVWNWAGSGTLSGTLVINSGGTLNITNNASYIFSGTMTNHGTVNWTAGNLYGDANTAIYNTGLWLAQSDNQFIVNSGSGQAFINAGTFQKIGGTGTTIIAWNFNTTGTMDVQSGFVNINNWSGNSVLNGTLSGTGSTSSGTLTLSSGSQWNWNGGNMNGSIVVATNATINWISGGAGGSLTVNSGGTINITNNASYILSGAFTNNGTVNWTAGNFYGDANAVIYNAGMWLVQSDNQFIINSGSGQTFINTGTFRKTGGSGTTIIAWNFNTTGTMDIQQGFLKTSSWIGTSVLNGVMTSYSSTFNGSLTVASNSMLTLNADTISSNLTIAAGGVLNITNNTSYIFSGVLTNSGTVNWSAGNLYGDANTVVYNAGLWRAQSDNQFIVNSGSGQAFINTGTFRKTGGSGTTIVGWGFTNSFGILDAQTNTLSLSGNYDLTGGTLNVGISSLGSYGVIHLSGNPAMLGGTLSANLNNGYVPTTNNLFSVLTYSSKSGAFTNFNLPTAVVWQTNYGGTAFTMTVAGAASESTNLLGDTVHVNYLYSETNEIYINFPSTNVTAAGVSFNIFGNELLTVSPTTITMSQINGSIFTAAHFNGFSVEDLTSPGKLAHVTIDPASNLAGFDASRIYFDGTTLYLNFQGLSTPVGSFVQLDVTTNGVAPPLAVIRTSLPGATNGVPYSQTLAASGGLPPYSWTNISGTLPTGLNLAANGVISGTPTTNGMFNFTVQVRDANSSTATQALSLAVFAPPAISAQPPDEMVTNGSPAFLAVGVSGAAPLFFKWQKNGVNLTDGPIISGSSTSALSLNAASNSDSGNYSVIITNAYGSVTSSVVALTVIPATNQLNISLPLATGLGNKLDLGSFAGGQVLQLSFVGHGDLVNSSYQTLPDGSLFAPAGSPYGNANPGASCSTVAGGDGINHYPGGGQIYDSGGGSGFPFAGKMTTDTTDPAGIRAGTVVGTFNPSPSNTNWFDIGYGGTLVVPPGGAHLYVAVNDTVNSDNHGTYFGMLVTVAVVAPPALTVSLSSGTGVVAGASGNFVFASSPVVSGQPQSVAVADVNGDGKPDLMANGLVLTNNGSGGFGSNSTYSVGAFGSTCVVASDVNGDGKPDLITANYGTTTLTVLTNNGVGVFGSNATLEVNSSPQCVVAADVNGDGKPDLICASSSGARFLTVFTNNGAGVFGLNSTPANGNVRAYSVVAADINGDNNLDLITANFTADTLTVLTNKGVGTFGLNSTYAVGSQPRSVVVADVNGDGKVDLICANTGDGTLTVLTNNGGGIFASNSTYAVGSQPRSVVAADVNGDNKPDLICANAGTGSLTVLTNNGFGIFASNATCTVGAAPYSVVAADVNGDGLADLVSANEGSGTLTVLTNTAVVVSAPFKNVVLSWTTNAAGFALQQNSNLVTANWLDVTNSPVVTNGLNQVILPAAPQSDFYRLLHQ